MKNKSFRFRRILACLIDFMISYVPCLLFALVLQPLVPGSLVTLIILITVITILVTFVMRDYLFNGRSIGKRIMKLAILDADMRSKPTAKQLICKNLIFLFFNSYDALFLLISGNSIGEKLSRTVVVSEQQLQYTDTASDAEQPDCANQGTTARKRAAVAAATVLCIAIPLFLFISAIDNSVKKDENYQIAYSYLIESDAYAALQAKESQIAMTGYNSSTQIDRETNTSTSTATFTFVVGRQQYKVVCHKDDGSWYVCDDCTDFE